MSPREYDLMRRVEDVYWWYAVLRKNVARDVAAFLSSLQSPSASPMSLLDAGCGTGGMLDTLRDKIPALKLSGLDFSPQAVGITRERGFSEVCVGSVDALPFSSAQFDALVSLDVLYFEGVDERRSLMEFHRVLRPGGVAILNLPAFDCLRGEHDVAVRGARRYTPSRVRGLLEQAGFTVSRAHCWNAWLFFPILLWRTVTRLLARKSEEARSDLSLLPAPVNCLLKTLASLDMGFCRLIHAPVGTSVYAVAMKPAASLPEKS
jgi:SAM-dependent methyltransferase